MTSLMYCRRKLKSSLILLNIIALSIKNQCNNIEEANGFGTSRHAGYRYYSALMEMDVILTLKVQWPHSVAFSPWT